MFVRSSIERDDLRPVLYLSALRFIIRYCRGTRSNFRSTFPFLLIPYHRCYLFALDALVVSCQTTGFPVFACCPFLYPIIFRLVSCAFHFALSNLSVSDCVKKLLVFVRASHTLWLMFHRVHWLLGAKIHYLDNLAVPLFDVFANVCRDKK